jgi:uncharacterized membrane protein YeaQ/YmgE (transglycosylase-associated protein family)
LETTMIERRHVRRVTPVVLAAAALLVAGDVVGSLAGKPLGFPYSPLGVVSLLVYFVVGFVGAWRATFAAGLLAAAIVGFLDATVGPLFAWLAGPGSLGQSVTEPRVFAYSITVGTVIAAVAGLVGAVTGSWLERRRSFRGSGVVSH